MSHFEKIIDTQDIYDGKVITVKKHKVKLEDNSISFREEVYHHGGACVLAIVDDKVVFVKQFRLSQNKEVLEIPAGKLEKGESPLDCAKRELCEEVGLKANTFKEICKFTPSPGYTNEIIYIYQASDFIKCNTHFDSDEFLDCLLIPVDEAIKMLDNGDIIDGKTIIALYYLKANLMQ